jgi:hypothetical protein
MNIALFRASFMQPGAGLNPLSLLFRSTVEIELRRVEEGGHSFAAFWVAPKCLGATQLLTKQTLIPLARRVGLLFERQLTDWQAFDYAGNQQPLVDAEIKKQLAEYGRRHPKAQKLLAG